MLIPNFVKAYLQVLSYFGNPTDMFSKDTEDGFFRKQLCLLYKCLGWYFMFYVYCSQKNPGIMHTM